MKTFDVYNPKLWDFLRARIFPDVVVEIGTFRGAWVRQYIDAGFPGRIYSIDPMNGLQGGFAKNAAFWHQIVGDDAWRRAFLLRGTSAEWVRLFDLTCDLLFVDGSHATNDVLFDLNHWWPKVRRGGLVLAHDIQSQKVRDAVDRFTQSLEISFEEFESGPTLHGVTAWMAVVRKP